MRNVEIKAHARNLQELIKRAKSLSGSAGITIPQVDTFYKTNQGRLKLRQFQNKSAELIFYDRPDSEGPKLSTFEKLELQPENVNKMNRILSNALGIKGEVKKVRELFLVDQTRIHIDKVEKLGDFVELEVVLQDHQTVEMGEGIANDLMEKLGIEKSDLLSNAYMDLLLKD